MQKKINYRCKETPIVLRIVVIHIRDDILITRVSRENKAQTDRFKIRFNFRRYITTQTRASRDFTSEIIISSRFAGERHFRSILICQSQSIDNLITLFFFLFIGILLQKSFERMRHCLMKWLAKYTMMREGEGGEKKTGGNNNWE